MTVGGTRVVNAGSNRTGIFFYFIPILLMPCRCVLVLESFHMLLRISISYYQVLSDNDPKKIKHCLQIQ